MSKTKLIIIIIKCNILYSNYNKNFRIKLILLFLKYYIIIYTTYTTLELYNTDKSLIGGYFKLITYSLYYLLITYLSYTTRELVLILIYIVIMGHTTKQCIQIILIKITALIDILSILISLVAVKARFIYYKNTLNLIFYK